MFKNKENINTLLLNWLHFATLLDDYFLSIDDYVMFISNRLSIESLINDKMLDDKQLEYISIADISVDKKIQKSKKPLIKTEYIHNDLAMKLYYTIPKFRENSESNFEYFL